MFAKLVREGSLEQTRVGPDTRRTGEAGIDFELEEQWAHLLAN